MIVNQGIRIQNGEGAACDWSILFFSLYLNLRFSRLPFDLGRSKAVSNKFQIVLLIFLTFGLKTFEPFKSSASRKT